jgi:hypothetical protein
MRSYWGIFAAAASAKLVTYSNTLPRRDTVGNIMNAHDGTTRRYGLGSANPFYYTAMGYPSCNETGQINGCTNCIYGVNNTITVWSSPDLSSGSWEVVSPVYPGPAGPHHHRITRHAVRASSENVVCFF